MSERDSVEQQAMREAAPLTDGELDEMRARALEDQGPYHETQTVSWWDVVRLIATIDALKREAGGDE